MMACRPLFKSINKYSLKIDKKDLMRQWQKNSRSSLICYQILFFDLGKFLTIYGSFRLVVADSQLYQKQVWGLLQKFIKPSDNFEYEINKYDKSQKCFQMGTNYVNNLQQFFMPNTEQKQSNTIGSFTGEYEVKNQLEDADDQYNGNIDKKDKFFNIDLTSILEPIYSSSTEWNKDHMLDNFQENPNYFGDIGSYQDSNNLFQDPQPQQKMQKVQLIQDITIKQIKINPQKKKQEQNTINIENIENKRKDGKEATQNAASKAFTLTLSIIRNGQKKKAKKNEMKLQFENFLNQNNARFSQTILIFIYIYLRRLKTSPENFHLIGSNLLSYYKEKIEKYNQEITLLRFDAYNKIIQNYYLKYDGKEINLNWVIVTFTPLFHGKQRSRLQDPIIKIRNCIENFDTAELTNDYHMKTPYKNIQ